jgi:hypothetical protein
MRLGLGVCLCLLFSFPFNYIALVSLSILYFEEFSLTNILLLDIASISKIEGKNWRHGDVEDVIKTLAFIKGHKWTSMMVKRVYFGNWLRD